MTAHDSEAIGASELPKPYSSAPPVSELRVRPQNTGGLALDVRTAPSTLPVPCLRVALVATCLVVENLYNPNEVSPDKMELLETSILSNGFCFPVVTVWDPEQERIVVIDGAHRRQILGADFRAHDCGEEATSQPPGHRDESLRKPAHE